MSCESEVPVVNKTSLLYLEDKSSSDNINCKWCKSKLTTEGKRDYRKYKAKVSRTKHRIRFIRRMTLLHEGRHYKFVHNPKRKRLSYLEDEYEKHELTSRNRIAKYYEQLNVLHKDLSDFKAQSRVELCYNIDYHYDKICPYIQKKKYNL